MMQMYDLVIVEEFAQLSQYHFERLLRLWDAADRRPGLVFCGDFCQLQGVDPTRANHSEIWNSPLVHKIELRTMRRCECPELRWKLELLRNYKPSPGQLRRILRKHRAPSREFRPAVYGGAWPTEEELMAVFTETPDTDFLVQTRHAAAYVNAAAEKLYFSGQEPLACVPAEPEQNPNNYEGFEMISWEPSELKIYTGQRLFITKNENKKHDFVNGMGCTVQEMDRHGVLVRTDTNRMLLVHPMTDSETKIAYFPLRMGYATTLHKIQGMTLKHVTLWLNKKFWPAAAYVALSRVKLDAHWRFVGEVTPEHCIPAEQ
jgi:hypothetical protein